ncbi:hypothetical protein ACROYT_G031158 [Oculina patagonica]
MSVGYKDYAHATLDILNKFGWKKIALVIDEVHWLEAGYFYSVSQTSRLSVNFIQLSKLGESDRHSTAPILRAMEEIENLEAERVILLYANKENIEVMLQQRAEIGVAGLTITERREDVVDFSVPYMHFTEDILMKKPSSGRSIDLLQFMHPFNYYVWIATLASLVVISVAVFVLNYFSPYGYKDYNSRGTSEEFNFFNSAWFALASMLQQGANNTPRSLSVLSQKRIDLMSMLGVYAVMGTGIIVASLTLIVEILWKRRAKQKTINKKERVCTNEDHDH